MHGIEVLAQGDTGWRYVRYGCAIMAACGIDMTGRLVGEHEPRLAEYYEAAISAMRDIDAPVLAVDRRFDGGALHFWERMIMPCRAADGTLRILAYVRPRGGREDLLATMFEASRDGMLVLRALRDPAGRFEDAEIVMANERARAGLGENSESMEGLRLGALFRGAAAESLRARCRRVITQRSPERFELNLGPLHEGGDGGGLWHRITILPLDDGAVMSFSDISDLKNALIEAESARRALAREVELRRRLEGELRQLSLTDDLTGLANRRALERKLRQEVSRIRRYGGRFCVIAVDLDHFKKLNDTYGHPAGDEVLIAVGALFADETRRDVDLVARTGGEEFMIVTPDTGLEGALDLAERLRRRLGATPFQLGDQTARVTASFGVHEYVPREGHQGLIAAVDAALYRAKNSGRNNVALPEGKRAIGQG
ncbi:MAG: sensor domain-containing diguanylate cyclase [Salinarimonas sp.]|nr:sensor domain-containing diguanylate cyclase [Salinarimonas sp.]